MRRCAPSTRTASTSCSPISALAANTSDRLKESDHARKDQARVVRRHRSLLHDDEEQEVRSRRSQARPVQGNKAEIARSTKPPSQNGGPRQHCLPAGYDVNLK